ncbi:MAG TPA: hypothetical protein VF840_07475 [Terriglobales bacterium]
MFAKDSGICVGGEMAERNNPTPNQNQLFGIFLELLAEPDFQALVAAVKPQHLEFLLSYLDSQSPGWRKRNKAAELAGYAGKPGSAQLSGQGSRVLKNPNVQQCMAAVFERAGCTLERDAKVISEAMTATRTRYLRGANNTIISTPAEPDHQTRLRAVVVKDRLLRIQTTTVTHQRLPAADSDAAASGEHDLCASCGEAMSKVAALNPADRALLRDITKFDQELRSADTPQQNAGEEHGELDAPGKNSC